MLLSFSLGTQEAFLMLDTYLKKCLFGENREGGKVGGNKEKGSQVV